MRYDGRQFRLVSAAIVGSLALLLSATALASLTEASSGRGAKLVGASPAAERAPDAAPNVILITTDDQSVDDMRVMHQVVARLGRRGTTFANAFSPYPLCCPARATLLTGQYAQNHHVLGNGPPMGGFGRFDDTNTLPLWLQQAGYRTIILGKYLNGYPNADDRRYIPPGWDDWRVPVAGLYNYRRWTLNENGLLASYAGYETDFVTDEAVSMIDSYSRRDEPFFMWAGYLAPHAGMPRERDDPTASVPETRIGTPAVAKKYQDSLAFLPLPDKANINEANVNDKPDAIRGRNRIPVGFLRELDQQRKESLLSVDDGVSRIVRELRVTGEFDNTVVIFTSDNGFMIGEHRKTGKVLGYEESVRVPLIISGPGFNTGARRSQKVSLVDIVATIADLADATPLLVQDGVSLRGIARDAQAPDARAILFQSGPTHAFPNVNRLYVGIRTNRYVYMEYATGEQELYNLRNDRQQLVNLAGRGQYQQIQNRLADALTELRHCAGATCLESPRELSRQ